MLTIDFVKVTYDYLKPSQYLKLLWQNTDTYIVYVLKFNSQGNSRFASA